MSEHPLIPFAAALWQPTDLVELRRITPPPADLSEEKSKVRETWLRASEVTTASTLAMLVKENEAGANIYAVINPLGRKRGKDEDVILARSFFVDFDGGVTPEQARQRISAALLPEPSLVLFSGHGSHCYWLLAAALQDMGVWRGVQQALIRLLASDDKIKNPSRVMRLPGFLNCKYEPFVAATLVEVHSDRRYGLEQFPTPLQLRGEARASADGRQESTAAPVAAMGATTPGPANLSRATLLFLHQGASEGERNNALFAAACDYAGNEIAQDQAKRELGDAARKCGLRNGEIKSAIDSAYAKARSAARPTKASCAPQSGAGVDVIFEHAAGAVRIDCKPGEERGRAILTVWSGQRPVFTDDIKITSSRSRADFIKKADRAFSGLDGEAVEQMLIAKAVELSRTPDPSDEPPPRSREELLAAIDERTEEMIASTAPDVLREAQERLRDPRLIDQIARDIEAAGVVGESRLAMTLYVQGTSRKLRRPLSAITQGVTSSGKSYVQECVAGMFPAEEVLLATDITTNALYYMPAGALIHKFVVAGERSRKEGDDRAEATRALREMIASGELRKLVPVKGADGKMVSQMLWQPGPIAFLESTTLATIFDEDANRCIQLGTDESQAQTERVVLAQAQSVVGDRNDPSGLLEVHHAMQRLLRRCRVRIPFALALARCIPTQRQDARRAMPQIFTMIQAVALIHQFQRADREITHGTEIVATIADYVVARELLVGPMGRSLGGGLPDAVVRFGKRLTERYGEEVFSSSDAARDDDHLHTKGKVNEYLRRLEEAGVAECVEPGKGSLPAKWKIVAAVPDAGEAWLPTVAQLLEARP